MTDEANEAYWLEIPAEDRSYLLGPRAWPGPCFFCGGRLVHSVPCQEQQRDWRLSVEMPWGKFKGVPVKEVRADYLRWFLAHVHDAPTELRDAMHERLSLGLTEAELSDLASMEAA
jgi:hypothetical protein